MGTNGNRCTTSEFNEDSISELGLGRANPCGKRFCSKAADDFVIKLLMLVGNVLYNGWEHQVSYLGPLLFETSESTKIGFLAESYPVAIPQVSYLGPHMLSRSRRKLGSWQSPTQRQSHQFSQLGPTLIQLTIILIGIGHEDRDLFLWRTGRHNEAVDGPGRCQDSSTPTGGTATTYNDRLIGIGCEDRDLYIRLQVKYSNARW